MMADLLSFHTSAASLPSLFLMQVWLGLGWSVTVAALSLWLLQRLGLRKAFAWCGAAVIAIWVAMPGDLGGHYWLGLAFQAPSIVTALLSVVWLVLLVSPRWAQHYERAFSLSQARALNWLGVMIGWVLLADTLGVFAGSLYSWGFSALAPAVAIFALAMPWALTGRLWTDEGSWIAVIAVVLFAVLQLPTGNVFDALIDPWLWIAFHIAAYKSLRYIK